MKGKEEKHSIEKLHNCKITQDNNGITLIALVITIIVLLILATVSLNAIVGKTGVVDKSEAATIEYKKAAYAEKLKVIGASILPDKAVNKWSTKKYMDKYRDDITKDVMFLNAKEVSEPFEDNGKWTIRVITIEGWVYWVTEKTVEYRGEGGAEPIVPPTQPTTDPEDQSDWIERNVRININCTSFNETLGEFLLYVVL